MPRYPVVYENGRKYLVIHGFKIRTGYIPARERRELANKFNLAPLTVMGPKPKLGHVAAASSPALPTTAARPASAVPTPAKPPQLEVLPVQQKPPRREVLPENHPEVQEEILGFSRHREGQRRPIQYPSRKPALPPQDPHGR
jgi:hypothetical protein